LQIDEINPNAVTDIIKLTLHPYGTSGGAVVSAVYVEDNSVSGRAQFNAPLPYSSVAVECPAISQKPAFICSDICGNGIMENPDESCDDGDYNFICKPDCNGKNAGWTCNSGSSPSFTSCTFSTACGDGILGPSENCDDGSNDGYGC
jgi:hypothetical protein